MIADWAAAPVPVSALDTAAITALPQQRGARSWRPALAAAMAAGIIAAGAWIGLPGTGSAPAPQVASAPAASDSNAAFAVLFTPTASEEDLI